MKGVLSLLLMSIVLLTLQSTLLSLYPIQKVRPDLLFILTFYLAFLFQPIRGGILALLIGYLTDLFSGNPFGFYSLSRPLIFFAVQFFKERFYLEGFPFQFLFSFLFSLLEGILILFLMITFQASPHGAHPFMLIVSLSPQSLFTGLATPPLFVIFQRMMSIWLPKTEKGMMEGVG